jgi:succinyl-CoA synthetase beta subunit
VVLQNIIDVIEIHNIHPTNCLNLSSNNISDILKHVTENIPNNRIFVNTIGIISYGIYLPDIIKFVDNNKFIIVSDIIPISIK